MHVSPDQLPSTLRSLAAALCSGATLSFESRNPACREWERWTPAATYSERVTPLGLLREWLDVTDVRAGRVVFDAHNVLPDGNDRVYTSILFFRSADELRQELGQAGFADVSCAGDWQGSLADDTSRLYVFRARRA